MSIYAGLDVSDKSTHNCVVNADGAVIRRDQRQILGPIIVAEKDRQPPIVPLGHMVRDTGNDDAGKASHSHAHS
ncbi:MAG: hypothetical protein K2W81_10865 [Sphingomonas sp.]|uniref:hypothetical protein n=1 Tax=Sphingomonas sp. TaxID=28214 RepID=UPI0025EF2518|nr:hypothetical protein [Sphingomonas sp.]MBY0284450.1 hypothetical protein [Sphingomonas sp.]